MTNPDPIKEGLNLGLQNSIFWGAGYANAEIKSATSQAQYRYIALEVSTGFHLGPMLDLGVYHLSEHGIDRQMGGQPKYPSVNAVELKIYLYRRK